MALLAGFAVGLFGAIPPGPVNVNVIRKASRAETREALRVALGAALVDTVICGFVAMGFGWALEKVVSNTWTRLGLALFLLLGGLKILFLDRKRDAERAARPGLTAPPKEVSGFRFPLLVGVLQGGGEPRPLRQLDPPDLVPRRAPDPADRPPARRRLRRRGGARRLRLVRDPRRARREAAGSPRRGVDPQVVVRGRGPPPRVRPLVQLANRRRARLGDAHPVDGPPAPPLTISALVALVLSSPGGLSARRGA